MERQRDYRKEYDDYHALPEQRARRAARNRARYMLEKMRGKAALRGKHVDHKDFNAQNNKPSNLQVVPASENLKKQPKRS
jgi:hypothetical protein